MPEHLEVLVQLESVFLSLIDVHHLNLSLPTTLASVVSWLKSRIETPGPHVPIYSAR